MRFVVIVYDAAGDMKVHGIYRTFMRASNDAKAHAHAIVLPLMPCMGKTQ
jgi:hypothetical protein